MFFLPDGRKISEQIVDELLDAMLATQRSVYFFDLQNLAVICIPRAHKRKLTCFQEDGSQFIPIDHLDDRTIKDWMREFMKDVVSMFEKKDVCEAHLKLLDKETDSSEAIEDQLANLGDGYLEGWTTYRDDRAFDVLSDWLSKAPISAKQDPEYWFGDDDCTVCRYTKATEQGWITGTLDGLETAFEEQSKHGKTKKLSTKHGQSTTHACGLCGKTKKIVQTDCCAQWICDDEDQYVLFSYARNSCSRNHRQYTLCAFHHTEQHSGDWKRCKKCVNSFHAEIYDWFGSNEYNFETLETLLPFVPLRCSTCRNMILQSRDGYSACPDGTYRCERCNL